MHKPAKYRIADDLRGQILSGAVKPGDRLPSRGTLVTRYGLASDRPVVEAMRLLSTEGLVVARQGSGTFVLERPAPQRLVRKWGTPPLGTTAVTEAVTARLARAAEAADLGVAPGTAVLVITRTCRGGKTSSHIQPPVTEVLAGAEAVYEIPFTQG